MRLKWKPVVAPEDSAAVHQLVRIVEVIVCWVSVAGVPSSMVP
jgi:hypothetical protein